MISFWEKESFITYDYIIVGSGIVGLSTAISIKEKEPKARVLVLEQGIFPSGASTKNAGFACFGSLTELLSDLKTLGESGTLELVEERWQGLQKLRRRLSDDELGYHSYGGYELLREKELGFKSQIDEVNELLHPIFKSPVFKVDDSKIKEFGFNQNEIKSVIYNSFEGQVHTGRMMKSLIAFGQHIGISILTGTSVDHFLDTGNSVEVTATGSHYQKIEFKATKVAICTNAFTKKLIDEIDISPGRGIVLVTQPINELPFKGVFHIDEGYYYFRNFGNRVIFGGGRNLDFETETTTSFEINKSIEQELVRQLKEVILPETPFEVEHTWAGIMAFGKNKVPIFKQHSENVFLGVRLGGMGVAIGSQMGERLAERILND